MPPLASAVAAAGVRPRCGRQPSPRASGLVGGPDPVPDARLGHDQGPQRARAGRPPRASGGAGSRGREGSGAPAGTPRPRPPAGAGPESRGGRDGPRSTRRISNSRGVSSTRRSSTRTSWARLSSTSGPDRSSPSTAASRTAGAPQDRADAGVQLADRERLGHVVVGAALERLDLARLLAASREDHDRRRRFAPDAPEDADPLHVGQAQVEQDEIRPARLPAFDRRPAVRGRHDVVAAGRHVAPQRLASRLVVLDEQDLGTAGASVGVGHAGPAISASCAGAAGRSTSIARPPSSPRRASTAPPMASARPRTTDRPIPVPPLAAADRPAARKNLSNSRASPRAGPRGPRPRPSGGPRACRRTAGR